MSLVLDASMALAWCIVRADPAEAETAQLASDVVVSDGAQVPMLWFAEVANTLLVFERTKRFTEQVSSKFLLDLAQLSIAPDDELPAMTQPRMVELGRRYGLTAYDATYLELAMRRGAVLATFDRKLAEAARVAGVRVFGDGA